jgi:hypothetical protein
MKKAMILVAFVSFSAFANASNLSVKRHLEKVKPLIALSSSQGMGGFKFLTQLFN